MANKQNTANHTPITPMRLGADTLAALDRIAADRNLPTRTETVRNLVAEAEKKLLKKSGKSAAGS